MRATAIFPGTGRNQRSFHRNGRPSVRAGAIAAVSRTTSALGSFTRGVSMFARVLACAALLSTAGTAAAAEPKQPTGKWIVNFADAQCVATRNYGSEADPIYLVLKAPATGGSLQIGIVRKGRDIEPQQFDGEVVVDQAATIQTNLLEFGNKKIGQRALLVNLNSQNVDSLRPAKTLSIRTRDRGVAKLGTRLGQGGSRDGETFALTQMGAVMNMLDTCTKDLRDVWKAWDYDKEPSGLKEGPSGDLSGIFNGDDYPGIAAFKDQMGSVAFVLLIDEQGKVADCTVTETSGVASLDAQSCAIVKERAKFKPAIGLDGKPSKSSYFQRISWRLEG